MWEFHQNMDFQMLLQSRCHAFSFSHYYAYIINEWLLFNVNSWREQVNFQWEHDEVRFLDKHAKLDFHSASSVRQQSADRHVATLGTHYPVSELNSLWCFFLMLRAYLREKQKYQFYSLWFDQTEIRTHDLPHSRRTR